MSHRPLSEQVIVITGASSGIGLVTAREAARRGARLVLTARNGTDLNRLRDEIEREGGSAIAVPADVTRPDELEQLAKRALQTYGRIDTWVSNAAVSVYGEFTEIPAEDFRRVMDVTFFGQINSARVALPLLEREGGALICIGSVLSDHGIALQSPYSAAKHALKGWLESVRVELMHRGSAVRVTLIKPASIDTPFYSKAKSVMGVAPKPISPLYDPDQVADAILHAAANDVAEMYVGAAGRAWGMAAKVAPRLLERAQTRGAYQQQMSSSAKRPDAPSNLHEPLSDDGGARGGFGARRSRRTRHVLIAAGLVMTGVMLWRSPKRW